MQERRSVIASKRRARSTVISDDECEWTARNAMARSRSGLSQDM
jgi:hypothetical protein